MKKTEKLFLSLNIINTIGLLFYLFTPGFFTHSYWAVSIVKVKVPVFLLFNIAFLFYWLVRTRYYFLISLCCVFLFAYQLVQKYGWDTVQNESLAYITVSNNGEDPIVVPDYLGKNAEVPNHPRLLLMAGDDQGVMKGLSMSPEWSNVHQVILKAADQILAQTQRKIDDNGNQVLPSSKEAFRRLLFLSYSWRITKQEKYKKATLNELMNLAYSDNWRPKYYLTTAEITLGMAIAYDWMYDDVPQPDRIVIEKAIITKGLEPSLDSYYNGWLDETSETNQICNAAMIYGALVVYDSDNKLAKDIINRSIESLSRGMNLYAPDGVHPSGYVAGNYGTVCNALVIDALNKLFGKDFGLSKKKGFLQSGNYFRNLIGPTGAPFNYSDGEAKIGVGPTASLYWLAKHTGNAQLLWNVNEILENVNIKSLSANRLTPITLIWGIASKGVLPHKPEDNIYVVKGKSAVAVMRTSWDDSNAIFVGLKAGSPANGYGHMDVGSFILDADGKRWAMDLGGDNLFKLDYNGINTQDMSQDSRRWQVFRNNSRSHSTLTVNNDYQQVASTADIVRSANDKNFMYAVTDMSSTYQGSLNSASRGVAIVDQKYVQVRDEIETMNADNSVRWKMLTPSKVKILSDNLAELTQDDKKFYLRVIEPAIVKLQTWSTSPSYPYEMPNPNSALIGFEVKGNKREKVAISVVLSDDQNRIVAIKSIKPLQKW